MIWVVTHEQLDALHRLARECAAVSMLEGFDRQRFVRGAQEICGREWIGDEDVQIVLEDDLCPTP